MAWPFRKVPRRNPLPHKGLHRLPPRSAPRLQPASRDHPLYRQQAFGNIVTSVYAAIIRECAAKGKDARFRRAEVKETRDGRAVSLRGYFELTEAGKGR